MLIQAILTSVVFICPGPSIADCVSEITQAWQEQTHQERQADEAAGLQAAPRTHEPDPSMLQHGSPDFRERVPIMKDAIQLKSATENRVELPYFSVLECGIERETPAAAILYAGQTLTEVTLVFYDTNSDGKIDAHVEIWPGDDYPTFYTFDRTYNGKADIIYEDTARDGTCSGIKVRWVYQHDDPKEYA